jgi:hypothetical protein
MNLFTKYVAGYRLSKIARLPREKSFVKIPDAKTIGVIFEATEKEDFETIRKFIQQLKEYTKNVHAIGYVDAKITPDYSYIKTDFDFFNKKELKNLYQPQSPYIRTFMDEPRDLLISANLGGKLPLTFVTAASKAKCKVGIHAGDNELFHDVLINTPVEQGLEFFLRQSLKYLS